MEGVTAKQLPTNQANLSLYPNPSNDQLTIKYNINEAGPVSIIIIDAQGRVLLYSTEGMTNAGDHTIIPDIGKLKPGIYSVSLQTEKGNLVRKLCKL
ncbi:MAG TPA: T9SS type A sorting domain-containing protein [Lentimicrobium sp.]|nr:T9SS type A sorting domain-containing protein [Lentimicrobium sp.]